MGQGISPTGPARSGRRDEMECINFIVMAGLVPAIHVFAAAKDVDARHKAGHDELDGIDEKRKRRSARLAVKKKLPPKMKLCR